MQKVIKQLDKQSQPVDIDNSSYWWTGTPNEYELIKTWTDEKLTAMQEELLLIGLMCPKIEIEIKRRKDLKQHIYYVNGCIKVMPVESEVYYTKADLDASVLETIEVEPEIDILDLSDFLDEEPEKISDEGMNEIVVDYSLDFRQPPQTPKPNRPKPKTRG